MKLKQYYGKTITVVDSNEQIFKGIVSDFFFAEDNESGTESIVLETEEGELYEFTEENISRIIEK